MKRLPARVRRPNAIAALVVSLAAIAVGIANLASSSRDFRWVVTPYDLFAVQWSAGQFQFYRGVHLVMRYDVPAPESTSAFPVPTIERVAWDAAEPASSPIGSRTRPQLGWFRLKMRDWPPLLDPASVLIGGHIAVPVKAGSGRLAMGYREFGWRLTARAMAAWPIVAMLALLAAWFGRRAWRASIPTGGCPRCGYDLRASPDRCPECGAAIAVSAS